MEGGRENKKPFGSVQGHACVSDRGELHMYARVHEHLKSLTELQVIQIDKNPPIRLDHIDQACVQCNKTVRVENWQDNHCSFRAVRWKLNGGFKNVLKRLRIQTFSWSMGIKLWEGGVVVQELAKGMYRVAKGLP